MNRTQPKTILFALLVPLLAAVLLAGCTAKPKPDETAGKGYFGDVDYGMTLDEVAEAEKARSDSGEAKPLLQYSCIYYEHVTWDGYDANVYYIANADGVHLDTILVNVNGAFDFDKTKATFSELYTDGSGPEQSDSEYYAWSGEDRIIVAQSNRDTTAMITFMLKSAVATEEESGEGESK